MNESILINVNIKYRLCIFLVSFFRVPNNCCGFVCVSYSVNLHVYHEMQMQRSSKSGMNAGLKCFNYIYDGINSKCNTVRKLRVFILVVSILII